jgi:hypothetical protein
MQNQLIATHFNLDCNKIRRLHDFLFRSSSAKSKKSIWKYEVNCIKYEVIYIILTPRAGRVRLKRNVPGPWINTGRNWWAWFTIIFLKHQFPKIEDFKPKSMLWFLAILASSSISISITYILFLTKMQKGKPSKMDLPLLKYDITGSESTFKMTDT